MAKPNHIPTFGNWDSKDHVPYTVVFNNAQIGKGGKMINPNDPMENAALFGKGSDVSNDPVARPPDQHQRRGSRDDSEFGAGNQGHGRGRHSSRVEEESFESGLGRNGNSPLHPQAYGRLGRKLDSPSPARAPGTPNRKLGSASPARAPGTPNRNRPERSANPLPKFGEWVNDPSSAEGMTAIFDVSVDAKKKGGTHHIQDSPLKASPVASKTNQERRRWFCRCFQPSTV